MVLVRSPVCQDARLISGNHLVTGELLRLQETPCGLGIIISACSSSPTQVSYAGAMADLASVDQAVPDLACPPTVLMMGGSDVAAQG